MQLSLVRRSYSTAIRTSFHKFYMLFLRVKKGLSLSSLFPSSQAPLLRSNLSSYPPFPIMTLKTILLELSGYAY